MSEYTAVSLFCGAGGLDIGFEQAGIHTIWANDFNTDACNTHKLWSNAEIVCGDIGKIDKETIPIADVMLGGFPCQGFSLSGPRKLDDSRNTLYKHYVEIVKMKQPKVFVGENVKGLLSMGNGEIIDAIIAAFAECGYNVFYQLVNAKNYGVPQDRERVIITGFRHDLQVQDFQLKPFNGASSTLRDAIGWMSTPDTSDVCQEAYSSRYMSRNRKRGWDDVSFTIPAMAKQVTLHPSSPDMIKLDKDLWKFGDGLTRRLSWQEAAAIQTFPEEMQFCGNLTSKYKQIGNAVPVKLARHVAQSILPILDSYTQASQ
ncbi:MAG: DNA cytosine methyltransferase [Bacteroidaceae bacterium]|nr:DNA cytosine methyltransferase [Bacteroidaceae bacterium]